MGLFESAKIWRTGGTLLGNRVVAAAMQQTGGLVNKRAAATMTPRMNDAVFSDQAGNRVEEVSRSLRIQYRNRKQSMAVKGDGLSDLDRSLDDWV
jgi:hypothetical protein